MTQTIIPRPFQSNRYDNESMQHLLKKVTLNSIYARNAIFPILLNTCIQSKVSMPLHYLARDV